MKKLIIISYLPDLIFWISCITDRNIKKRDLKWLRKKYILNLNGWNYGHIISYIMKGYIFKRNYIITFFLIGLIFEFIEYFVQYKTAVNYVVCDIITDPIINTLSYISGMYINKFVKTIILFKKT
jgi:hypothetical protein